VKLRHLDRWNDERRRAAARYAAQLTGINGGVLTEVAAWAEPAFHLYVVRVPDRDRAREFLQEHGVSTGIHYPVPVHLQEACANLGLGVGSFPVAERLASEIVSLPMFAGITDSEVDRVCETLQEWVCVEATPDR